MLSIYTCCRSKALFAAILELDHVGLRRILDGAGEGTLSLLRSRDKDLQSPLHVAGVNGQLEMVELLVDRGSDVNARGQNGATPLDWCAYRGRLKVVQLLLDRKADLEITNTFKNTALHSASAAGHLVSLPLFFRLSFI